VVRQSELNIPLYVMGKKITCFLPSVRKVVESHYKSSKLFVVANCGHVWNNPMFFNEAVLSFMSGTK
jgi:hypothetical protein